MLELTKLALPFQLGIAYLAGIFLQNNLTHATHCCLLLVTTPARADTLRERRSVLMPPTPELAFSWRLSATKIRVQRYGSVLCNRGQLFARDRAEASTTLRSS